jgi:CHAD domain-containing protein
MTRKRQIEAGDFFYRYFIKRTSSFHATLYKAGITATDDDIHKARVDLKKVFALFSFFEVLGPGNFNKKKYSSVFKDIFIKAGKMRECQVNILCVESFVQDYPGVLLFINYLKSEQKKSAKGFISAVFQFDEKKLKEISNSIKKVCSEIKSDAIIERTVAYLIERTGKIESIMDKSGDPETIHTIRKELKKVGAILSLLQQVKPAEDQENLLKLLNKTESLIGDWHDRIVLIDSFTRFFKANNQIEVTSFNQLKNLQELINRETGLKLDKLIPYVNEVVKVTNDMFPLRING